MQVALKVDVDTFRGMREGLPRLLEILKVRSIQATVFVSMGPDHSGRAIRRILTKRGFLGKMLRTRVVSLYGPRTLLYGTLLPGPRIAEGNADLFRRIEAEGHEAGVHGWDHVRWQDGLPRFDETTIAAELAKALEVFENVAGHAPLATAAPGWIANARSLAVQDRLGLDYSSDVRGSHPFVPRMEGRIFRTPQVPTTLPTLDELIGLEAGPEEAINDRLLAEARSQALARPEAPIVHTVHTEVEGLSRAGLFADLIDRFLAEGARFARIDQCLARYARGRSEAPPAEQRPLDPPGDDGRPPTRRTPGAADLPVCEVRGGSLPGRSGTLALQISGG